MVALGCLWVPSALVDPAIRARRADLAAQEALGAPARLEGAVEPRNDRLLFGASDTRCSRRFRPRRLFDPSVAAAAVVAAAVVVVVAAAAAVVGDAVRGSPCRRGGRGRRR